MSDLKYSQLEMQKSVAIIKFNRPDSYNSMNREMKLELIKTLKKLGQDSNVKSIILTGNGKAFSSGQDLNDRTVKSSEGPVDLGFTLETEWNPLVEAIRSNPKIVIAAINGVAAGAGLSVALSCDLKFTRPQIKFVCGFAQIGLVPDAGSSFILTKSLGYSKALEFILSGKPLLSEDLLNFGLINGINADEMEISLKAAHAIGELPPLAVFHVKKNLQFALDHSYEESLQRETALQRFLGRSHDYAEGVSAFFEKRKANFKGM